jgi:hypothetical protein
MDGYRGVYIASSIGRDGSVKSASNIPRPILDRKIGRDKGVYQTNNIVIGRVRGFYIPSNITGDTGVCITRNTFSDIVFCMARNKAVLVVSL